MKKTAEKQGDSPLAGDVEVQSKLEVKHAVELQKLGTEIIKAMGVAGEKYLALCTYIRKNDLAPKLVSFELSRLGFTKSTVSKIARVAFASEELYSQYQAKLLGFDRVLMLARTEGPAGGERATPAAKALHEAGSVSDEEIAEAGALEEEGGVSKKSASKSATPAMKIESGLSLIFKALSAMKPKGLKNYQGPLARPLESGRLFQLGRYIVVIQDNPDFVAQPVSADNK